MKVLLPFVLAFTGPFAYAQTTPMGQPTSGPLPTTVPGYSAPGTTPAGPAPADGAIQTPESLRQQSLDSVNTRQSGPNRVLTPQEQQFRRNLQGQPPQAIPSQGIGIPDPMNPNPNVPPTTPIPPTVR